MVCGNIVGGPGRFDLMLGLFEAKQLRLKIKMGDWVRPACVEACIYGVESDLSHHEGRRESWSIHGHLKFSDEQKKASGTRGVIFNALYFTRPTEEGFRGRIWLRESLPQI